MRLDQLLTDAKGGGLPIASILERAHDAGVPRDQLPDVARLYALARPPVRGKPHLTKPIENHTTWAIAKGLGIPLSAVWLAVGDSIWGEGAMFRGPEDEEIVRLPSGWYDLDPERFRLWREIGGILVRDQRNAGAVSDLRAAHARIAELEAILEAAPKARKRPAAATQPTFSVG